MIIKNARTVALELHPSIHHAANVIDRIWRSLVGQHARVTGLGEEGHSKGSKHYGLEGDVRQRAIDIDADAEHLPAHVEERVLEELRKRLPPEEFLVLFEGKGTARAHIHIGYQPKGFDDG